MVKGQKGPICYAQKRADLKSLIVLSVPCERGDRTFYYSLLSLRGRHKTINAVR